eukprot:760245-Hanusia_phi.AAC.2
MGVGDENEVNGGRGARARESGYSYLVGKRVIHNSICLLQNFLRPDRQVLDPSDACSYEENRRSMVARGTCPGGRQTGVRRRGLWQREGTWNSASRRKSRPRCHLATSP